MKNRETEVMITNGMIDNFHFWAIQKKFTAIIINCFIQGDLKE